MKVEVNVVKKKKITLHDSPTGIVESLPQAAFLLALLPFTIHLKAWGGVDRSGDIVPLLWKIRIHGRLLLVQKVSNIKIIKTKQRQQQKVSTYF